MKIRRIIQSEIEPTLGKGKAIIIYGARQVGKTTLAKDIEANFKGKTRFLNCDEPDVLDNLTNKTSTELKNYIGNADLVILDEAQRVENIGLTIKLLVDSTPEMQIIATGSSSLDLANKISEPLTGRILTHELFPLSLSELTTIYSTEDIFRLLPKFLTFGLYPGVVFSDNPKKLLFEIAQSYLLKDILSFQKIRNPQVLTKLLQALALQIGNEVSTKELGNLVGIDKETVERYLDLLEKAFIITSLPPFSRNLRKEINKMRKVYFTDIGIRNALIRNFNPVDLRIDIGSIFENIMVLEKIKKLKNDQQLANFYFWRTYDQKEIDLLVERSGKLSGFEFKWAKTKFRPPKDFLDSYPGSTITLVNRENFMDILAP